MASPKKTNPKPTRPRPHQFLLALLVLAVLLAAFAASHALAPGASTGLTRMAQRLRSLGPTGWLIFIAAETLIALIGILPASLLGIAAGGVYGIAGGLATSALGILAGAAIAFSLSRSLARPLIQGFLSRKAHLTSIDHLLATDSWRLVALLRISPVMPFSLTSYALGLSGISTKAYLTGTLASLPALLGYVVIGALTGSNLANSQTALGSKAGLIHAALLTLGAAATLALTIHLSRLLARALKPA